MKNRAAVLIASLVVLFVGIASAMPLILATYSGFTGNGRGGPIASRPNCEDVYRGRDWALYGTPNDGTSTDIQEVCVYTSNGTYSWEQISLSSDPGVAIWTGTPLYTSITGTAQAAQFSGVLRGRAAYVDTIGGFTYGNGNLPPDYDSFISLNAGVQGDSLKVADLELSRNGSDASVSFAPDPSITTYTFNLSSPLGKVLLTMQETPSLSYIGLSGTDGVWVLGGDEAKLIFSQNGFRQFAFSDTNADLQFQDNTGITFADFPKDTTKDIILGRMDRVQITDIRGGAKLRQFSANIIPVCVGVNVPAGDCTDYNITTGAGTISTSTYSSPAMPSVLDSHLSADCVWNGATGVSVRVCNHDPVTVHCPPSGTYVCNVFN